MAGHGDRLVEADTTRVCQHGARPGEGQGATFTSPCPSWPRSRPRRPPVCGRCGAALRIVVIEDNADAAETLVMWLEELGHSVRLAMIGPNSLDLVRDGDGTTAA